MGVFPDPQCSLFGDTRVLLLAPHSLCTHTFAAPAPDPGSGGVPVPSAFHCPDYVSEPKCRSSFRTAACSSAIFFTGFGGLSLSEI